MSNHSTFDLVVRGENLDELRAARDLLETAPWRWDFLPIERTLLPDEGFRFRCRVWSDEEAEGKVITSENGIITDLHGIFDGLSIEGRFRDELGLGTIVGFDKDYEHRFDEEEEGDLLDAPDAALLLWSPTPLDPAIEGFVRRLRGLGDLLVTVLDASDVGFTLVDEETKLWSVSATVPGLEFEQVRKLCSQLRHLRVPLDARIERGERVLSVWPVSQRPWRQIL